MCSSHPRLIDEEVLAKAVDFLERAKKANKPFFCWFNSTRMHNFTHVKKENLGKTGLGFSADGMYAAEGLTAVWATENTRGAIFDAMERREAYATTGTRIRVRFFGGWEFTRDDEKHRDLAQIGYSKGLRPLALPSSAPSGPTPISTRNSSPSTTPASSRFPLPAGPLTMPRGLV